MNNKKNSESENTILSDYYKAYEKRYKQVYEKNMMWSSSDFTPDVIKVINEFNISKNDKILDLGCGEGRDAIYRLNKNYNVLAVDYSKTVIDKCNEITNNKFKNSFRQFDLLVDNLNTKYDFIYSVAVMHMFLLEQHRNRYLQFIYRHLKEDGIALICVLGNGKDEYCSSIEDAFKNVKRKVLNNNSDVYIATTSCKIVNWNNFEQELTNNNFVIIKKWLSNEIPEFKDSMCVVIKKEQE